MSAEHEAMARSLELLWGERAQPSRGPRPKMSVDKIVEAAVRIADAEGLGALSMQRVAAELGYTTMSLYRYVPAKEQLVDLMVDHAIGTPPAELTAEQHWRAALTGWAHAFWAVCQRHPWLLKVQADRPPVGPNQLSWLECGLRALAGLGFEGYERVSVVTFIFAAVQGLAKVSVDQRPLTDHAEGPVANAYAATLGRFVSPDRYPELAGIMAGGAFDVPADHPEPNDVLPDLEFGLSHLLNGIEAFVQARQSAVS
ncbi:TetR/AcrR family transcriptional regulator [Crossiella sp. CA-258035]|uniref:TetR/AcrR family transcriptional regulator n=1 Tax=Crossiella sp. CA-258035 TaxID=2981138 RepID=UPI0024BC43AD|nr:TetR/AcrR family transcriptional regulator [Crossiella sp. CA-258035]WHT21268.1 TetR/AcrR family transcriptional regulator [Crossiella sp. CA-258035]